MTQKQIAAELEAIKALLKSRGAHISYAVVQYWMMAYSAPHWQCKVSIIGEPDINADHCPSAHDALAAARKMAESYRPAEERLCEILGATVAV